ncbi:MAG: type II toxin-antitoxin system Phd/YefM family antitoxin [Acidobacteria bacterium]|nr:type II toxin-antitoxin system Phd/YefM family antitoxin [Acidobacteriota bacterium]
MSATATVRDLRNRFPQVRKLVELEGEVVVTEQGTPAYRLTRYSPPDRRKPAPPKDYLTRLRRHQPRPISAAAAKALHDANRGER